MGKTLKPLVIGIIIGVVGLYTYQNPDVRLQVSEFVGGILDSVSEAPTPTPTAPAMVALPAQTATPAQVAPIEVSPTLTATSAPPPTETPEPSQPTAIPTFTPMPTPVSASYSIEVVSMEVLDDGQVDFLLEVRNDQTLDDEIAQLHMSVDGGAAELVNIIASLPPGEIASFAFARSLAPGPHTIRFSVGDSQTTVSVNVEGDSLTVSTLTPQPTAAATSTITPTQVSANTAVPTSTPTPNPTPEAAVSPDLRHLEEKTYMLKLINTERTKAGLDPVVLGDNIAAQLHAEAALENCFASHWGIDGLKPYMRYSLAGGYQSNGENGHGSDYCIKATDGYRAIVNIKTEVKQAMEGWMGSTGHSRNILGRWHKKVNIGLAWDSYNFLAYQHFEGDYVEYDELPTIEDGILRVSGRTKNGVRFESDYSLDIVIFYDPPTHPLTRGQVSRTYCYDNGLRIATLRQPLSGSLSWREDEYTTTHLPCPDPYDVPADSPSPESTDEALKFWQAAYTASSKASRKQTNVVPWITALTWSVAAEEDVPDAPGGANLLERLTWRLSNTPDKTIFEVTADISSLLSEHGPGVYSLMVWGWIQERHEVISQYSIFHGVTPPDTYSQ